MPCKAMLPVYLTLQTSFVEYSEVFVIHSEGIEGYSVKYFCRSVFFVFEPKRTLQKKIQAESRQTRSTYRVGLVLHGCW